MLHVLYAFAKQASKAEYDNYDENINYLDADRARAREQGKKMIHGGHSATL